ncbi:MAG: iron ABC transporter permease [Pseudomonadota bacterium]|nr:iron ABC transporter permease [Pseudomonadota bacterium]
MTASALPPAHRSGEPSFWCGLRPDSWSVATVTIASLVTLPVLVVLGFVFVPAGEVWQHLRETVLADYISHSLLLMLGVALGTLAIGVSAAWMCSMCRFPGRRVFEWALLLPMAMPAYIIAYTYTGMLDYAGPVQTQLREWFGWGYGDYWFPEIHSLPGAIIMLSLVLYPYVYLLARAAFLEQSICVLEVSRSLGSGPWGAFLRVALPMARPAIVTGLSLVMMETLADYGTVQYFGVNTFTTGIFRTWFGLGDSSAAAQLSALLLGFVLMLVALERWSRHQARFYNPGRRVQPLPGYRLKGWLGWLAFAGCLLPLALGFLVPASQLTAWALHTAEQVVDTGFVTLTINTLGLAAGTALIALALAVVLAYGKRIHPTRLIRASVTMSGMGYAIPGTVIALGVMLPFAAIDNFVDLWMETHFGIRTGLILSGTLVALVSAYTVRFLAVALNTVESGLGKISTTMDEAARSLGQPPRGVLGRIHMPMMRASLLTAVLLVFVDVMKELPATLILRPFNFNTLAVRTYELATDERLADSASSALAIVLAGIIPVILLSRLISRSRSVQHD